MFEGFNEIGTTTPLKSTAKEVKVMWSLCLYKYHAMKGYGKEDLIQFNVLLGF
jgi:hypothetical protein